MVISWFGWDIADHALISEETFGQWISRIESLVTARGWTIERLGNAIDLIFGNSERSIMPTEFFKFQRDWEALNEEFALRFSGVLDLMGENHECLNDAPCEVYIKGSKKYGDSIGRPQRKRCGKKQQQHAPDAGK